jgi:hypothetical protein
LGSTLRKRELTCPGPDTDPDLDSQAWEDYLSDPFRPELGLFDIDPQLKAHLAGRVGAGAAANHHFHAVRAGEWLGSLVQSDMAALGQEKDTFKYFLAFELEVFDSRARFLAFVNRDQPNPNVPGPRPLTYNERQLEKGMALSFFIWPNIDPFCNLNLVDAVLAPGTAPDVVKASASLRRARDFTRHARTGELGVLEKTKPLWLEAFKIRFLARREAPDRAVIDLSQSDDVILPGHYFRIPRAEDRLFIPAHFVSLFVDRGWRVEP